MADKLLGSFVWCELLTTDTAAAESFYKKVVGWTAKPFAPVGSYTVFNNSLNSGVGGVMKLPDQAKQMGAPPHWMMYVGTPDVDETAQRVAYLGGKVHKQPEEIPNVGRFAVLADPTGAVSAAFKSSSGDQEVGQPKPGEFCWETLNTTDIPKAQAFYTAVYGWKVGTFGPDMPTFGVADGMENQVASVMQPPPGVPSHWITYAVVTDLAAARERVKKLGGTVLMDSVDVPGVGTFAVVQDPQKAIICPFQPSMG